MRARGLKADISTAGNGTLGQNLLRFRENAKQEPRLGKAGPFTTVSAGCPTVPYTSSICCFNFLSLILPPWCTTRNHLLLEASQANAREPRKRILRRRTACSVAVELHQL